MQKFHDISIPDVGCIEIVIVMVFMTLKLSSRKICDAENSQISTP